MSDAKEHSGEDKGFKVVDRRRLKEEAPAEAPAQAAPKHDDEVLGPIDFSTFLVSLASSALIHLGESPHPDTGAKEVSLPHAQQTIDLLALLEEKTKGNLSAEEGKLLQALLRDLRLRFVGAAKP
jgi:hypothetical protein